LLGCALTELFFFLLFLMHNVRTHGIQVRMRDMFLKIQKKTKNDGDTITLDKNVWMEMLEDVNQSL